MKRLFNFSIISLILFSVKIGFSQELAVATESKLVDESLNISALIAKGNQLLTKGLFGTARPIWDSVLQTNPNHADANFKLGMCYRNSLDEQGKALPYFRKAVKDVTEKYNFFSSSSTSAPYDAHFFLAESYLTNDLADSALLQFIYYKTNYSGDNPIDIDRHIYMCLNAKNGPNSPRDVTLKNLGKALNTEFAETNPVVSIDNLTMFFSSRRTRKEGENKIDEKVGKYNEDIYVTVKNKEGKWESAQPYKYNTDNNETPLCLGANGTLYLKREENGTSDIYESVFQEGTWKQPQLITSINSSSNEIGASVSADGKYLYFSSDRVDGLGKFDIYQCEKKASGKWGKPKNLGNSINTEFNEISPFIHPNGRTLFYSANGYASKGMGGYDVYYAEMSDNGAWSEPQSMGYPINNVKDNLHYYIATGGVRYMTALKAGYSYDLYEIEGGGFDFENVDVGTQVIQLTTEMDVMDVMEREVEIEKEVEVIEVIEEIVEVEKEIEVQQFIDPTTGEIISPEEWQRKRDSIAKAEEEAKRRAEEERQQRELEKLRQMDSAVATAVDELQARLQAEIDTEKEKVKTIEEKVTGLEEQLKTSANKIAEAEKKVKAAEERAKQAEEKAKTAEDALAEAKEEMLKGADEKFKAAEVKAQKAEAMLAIANQMLKATEKKFKEAEIKTQKAETMLAIANQMLKATEKKLKEVKEKEKDALERLNKAMKKITEAETRAKKAENELRTMKGEKESAQPIVAAGNIEAGKAVAVYFGFNSSALNKSAKEQLGNLLDFIKKNPNKNLEIIGYTDNKGSWLANLSVSSNRAETVYNYLEENNIDEKQMVYYGKGSTSPATSNDTKENRKLNRRVEVLVLE
ncbi:PD40 domain-containing protein [Bacteroidales bacterium AH-315-I05]|nr:PD40 domain-containing protein [Bacteroidales bacterium AH-315-I05]